MDSLVAVPHLQLIHHGLPQAAFFRALSLCGKQMSETTPKTCCMQDMHPSEGAACVYSCSGKTQQTSSPPGEAAQPAWPAGDAGALGRVPPAGRQSAPSGTRAPSLWRSTSRGSVRTPRNGPGGGRAQWPPCCCCQHAWRRGRFDHARRQSCSRCGRCGGSRPRHRRGLRSSMPPTYEPADVCVAPARLATRACACRTTITTTITAAPQSTPRSAPLAAMRRRLCGRAALVLRAPVKAA